MRRAPALRAILSSRPRVELSVHGFQPLLVYVCVDLGRRNIGVAQHFLDDSQIRAVAEQVGGETMAEQVRVNICLQPECRASAFTICQMRTVVSFVPRLDRKISLPLRRFTSFGRSVAI